MSNNADNRACKNRLIAYLLLLFVGLSTAKCGDKDAEIGVVIPDGWIVLSSTDPIEFPYEGGNTVLNYTLGAGLKDSDFDLTLSGAGGDWITATLNDGKLSVVCEHSYLERARSTTLKIKYDDNHQHQISIRQNKAESIDDQLIKVISATADSEETSATDNHGNPVVLKNSYDKNRLTYFNSKFGVVTYPFHITYELESGRTLNRIVYTPRQEWNYYGCFNEFSVEVSTAQTPDTFVKIGEYQMGDTEGDKGDKYTTTPFQIILSAPVEDVKKVRFIVTKAYVDRVSVAEMEFFEASKNKFDYLNYFAGDMGFELKEGVTRNQIMQIPNKYFKTAALALLEGSYNTEFRWDKFRPFQHPSIKAAENKTAKYSLRDNPTGIYVKSGDKLPVFVKSIPAGRTIKLLIQDLNGGYGNYGEHELKAGYNEIDCKVGGLIYVLNHINDDIPLPVAMEKATAAQKKIIEDNTIEIHFCGANVSGYFDLLKHSKNDWDRILDMSIASSYGYIDVLGKYSHITWQARQFKNNTYRKGREIMLVNGTSIVDDGNTDKDEIVEIIENYDKLVYDQQDFAGLVKYHRMFNNRLHFCLDLTANSPNASDYRTVYPCKIESPYSAEMFYEPKAFPKRLWGPAHEAGHVNQLRPGMKWSGITEVTNNIFCLYAQEQNGAPCKLLVDKVNPKNEADVQQGSEIIYDAAIHFIVDGMRAHSLPYIKSIVREIQLVPFWQLYLYMVKARKQEDFYKDLFEHFRKYKSPSQDGGDAGLDQLDFVRQACKIAKLDLTDFFSRWGFLRACDGSLNDYGDKKFVVKQADIDALVKEIRAAGYGQPAPDVYKITDNTWRNYQ